MSVCEEQIFFEALDLDTPAQREAFAVSACGEDIALLTRIRRLLDAQANRDALFDTDTDTELNRFQCKWTQASLMHYSWSLLSTQHYNYKLSLSSVECSSYKNLWLSGKLFSFMKINLFTVGTKTKYSHHLVNLV